MQGCKLHNHLTWHFNCPQCLKNMQAQRRGEDRSIRNAVKATTARRCAEIALEQRCERGTDWDAACVAIATAILKEYPDAAK